MSRCKPPGDRPAEARSRASVEKTLPDILAPNLKVVFCGINPGLYSASVGCHFAHPSNRFWKVLCESGFTDRRLAPHEQAELLSYGCGLTNLVQRATTSAAELSKPELVRGRDLVAEKVRRFNPRFVGMLGLGAYRTAFGQKKAEVGLQDIELEGTRIWVLPNPSGLNARYRPRGLVFLFSRLRLAAFE